MAKTKREDWLKAAGAAAIGEQRMSETDEVVSGVPPKGPVLGGTLNTTNRWQ